MRRSLRDQMSTDHSRSLRSAPKNLCQPRTHLFVRWEIDLGEILPKARRSPIWFITIENSWCGFASHLMRPIHEQSHLWLLIDGPWDRGMKWPTGIEYVPFCEILTWYFFFFKHNFCVSVCENFFFLRKTFRKNYFNEIFIDLKSMETPEKQTETPEFPCPIKFKS